MQALQDFSCLPRYSKENLPCCYAMWLEQPRPIQPRRHLRSYCCENLKIKTLWPESASELYHSYKIFHAFKETKSSLPFS
jgi:hypothetical protein